MNRWGDRYEPENDQSVGVRPVADRIVEETVDAYPGTEFKVWCYNVWCFSEWSWDLVNWWGSQL